MAEIKLPHGFVAIVDDADFEWLSQWNWCKNIKGYVWRTGRRSDGNMCGRGIRMHRQIMNVIVPYIEVDHNKLDNRRCNLRLCSRSENSANSLVRADSASGYKGVFKEPGCKDRCWVAKIVLNGKHLCLGYFSTKEQAAFTYNEAAIKYFGEFACLNEVSR